MLAAGPAAARTLLAALACACSAATPKVADPTAAQKGSSMSTLMASQRFTRDCQDDLDAARTLLAQIKSVRERTVESVLEPYNRVLMHLGGALGRSELIAEVHPDAELRAAAEDCTRQGAKLDRERL